VKATEPVGFVAPANAGVMVAVKVTGWLTKEGDGTAATLVVVVSAVTTSATVPGPPARKFESPL
jgi:hypothetical protein